MNRGMLGRAGEIDSLCANVYASLENETVPNSK